MLDYSKVQHITHDQKAKVETLRGKCTGVLHDIDSQ